MLELGYDLPWPLHLLHTAFMFASDLLAALPAPRTFLQMRVSKPANRCQQCRPAQMLHASWTTAAGVKSKSF